MLFFDKVKEMEIDFQSINKEYNSYKKIYLNLLKKILLKLSLTIEPIVSVSLIDDETIHKINKKYRHIDRPTDVISFAFLDNEKNKETILKSNGVVVLGDIYISIDTALRQAKEYGHSVEREFSFLFTHGILHLLGYDHMNKNDETEMFALQNDILGDR